MATILKINGNKYQSFSKYKIVLKWNAIASTFTFSGVADFLPNPLDYSKCEIFRDNELLITGTIINQNRAKQPVPNIVNLSGYSLPGVLEDCNTPVNLYPLQSDNLSLFEISEKLIYGFGLDFVIADNDFSVGAAINKKFTKSIAAQGQTVKSYLNELASQRGIILSHWPDGRVYFIKTVTTTKPIKLNSIESYSFNVQGQQLHSEITVIKQASSSNPDSGQKTVKNPLVNAFRPKTKVLSSGDAFDVTEAAYNELRAELSTIVLAIKTKQIINPNTKGVIKPRDIIIQKVDGTSIERWFVEESTLEHAPETGEMLALKCVPAVVYGSDSELEQIS